jgi:hypothetical protein
VAIDIVDFVLPGMQGGIVNADDAKTLVGVGLSAVRLIRRGRRETAGHTAVGPTVSCLPFPGRYLDRFVQMKKNRHSKVATGFQQPDAIESAKRLQLAERAAD